MKKVKILLHRGKVGEISFFLRNSVFKDTILLISAEKLHDDSMETLEKSFLEVRVVEKYDYFGIVEFELLKIAQNYEIIGVFAQAEFDQERCASLCEMLGIKWLSNDEIKLFRDKLAMKNFLAKKEVKLPAFSKLENFADFYKFSQKHGYPLIIKPINSGGSVCVCKLTCENDFVALCKKGFFGEKPFLSTTFMVEKYIPYDTYHIDCLSDGNHEIISISKYFNDSLTYQNKFGFGSYDCDKNSIEYHELEKEFKKIINLLPSTNLNIYHAEFFYKKGKKPILCEIAYRIGGVCIPFALSYKGINPLDILLNAKVRTVEKNVYKKVGWYILYPQVGRVLLKKDVCELDNIIEYKVFVKNKEQINKNAIYVGDKIAHFIFSFETNKEALQTFEKIDTWTKKNIKVVK